MLNGILVVHRSGVLIASAGVKEKIKSESRLSNLISATLYIAETLSEDTVKSITTDKQQITITPCPTKPEALIVVLTSIEDENAQIIANYTAEVVKEALGEQMVPDAIPQALTDDITQALQQNVLDIELPSLETIIELTRTIYLEFTDKEYQNYKEQLRREGKERKGEERRAYKEAYKALANEIRIPEDTRNAIKKAVSMFYDCKFLPAFYIFTHLTESKRGDWAKLLAVATGLTLHSFLTDTPSPPLEKLRVLLDSIKREEGSISLLTTLLERKIDMFTNPIQGRKNLEAFLHTYVKVLLETFKEMDELKQSYLAILFTTVALYSKDMRKYLSDFFHGKSSFFYHLYTTRTESLESLLSFRENYNLPDWGQVYDVIVKMRRKYEDMKEKICSSKKSASGRKTGILKGILHLKLLYFLSAVADSFKGIKNLPKEAVKFLRDVHKDLQEQMFHLSREPGLLSLRDYIGILYYSTLIRSQLLEIVPSSKKDMAKEISSHLMEDLKIQYNLMGDIINKGEWKLTAMSFMGILPNAAMAVEYTGNNHIISLLLENSFPLLNRQQKNWQKLSFSRHWQRITELAITLTRLAKTLDQERREELLPRILEISRTLVNVSLAKGIISWSVFSNFILCAEEVVKVSTDLERLRKILSSCEKLRRVLLDPTKESWRRNKLVIAEINLLLTFMQTHGKKFPTLQEKAKGLLEHLLPLTSQTDLPLSVRRKVDSYYSQILKG